jgi:hypothetical protein
MNLFDFRSGVVYVSVHARAKLEHCDTFAHFRINRSGYIYAPAHTTSSNEDQGHIDAYPQQTHLILCSTADLFAALLLLLVRGFSQVV